MVSDIWEYLFPAERPLSWCIIAHAHTNVKANSSKKGSQVFPWLDLHDHASPLQVQLYIGNLSPDWQEDDAFEKAMATYGPLERAFVVRNADGLSKVRKPVSLISAGSEWLIGWSSAWLHCAFWEHYVMQMPSLFIIFSSGIFPLFLLASRTMIVKVLHTV